MAPLQWLNEIMKKKPIKGRIAAWMEDLAGIMDTGAHDRKRERTVTQGPENDNAREWVIEGGKGTARRPVRTGRGCGTGRALNVYPRRPAQSIFHDRWCFHLLMRYRFGGIGDHTFEPRCAWRWNSRRGWLAAAV